MAVSAPPAGGYSTAVWLSLPVKSRESISRRMAPPRASSSAPVAPEGWVTPCSRLTTIVSAGASGNRPPRALISIPECSLRGPRCC